MPQQITDHQNHRLGMSWGTPFADGYGISPTNNQELMELLSGKRRPRYKDRGYTYLDLNTSKTGEGKVVYSLMDLDATKVSAEWESACQRGEFEVPGLGTENMKAETVRFDKGSQQSEPGTRVTLAKSGQMAVGIWTLEWQRDEGGKLKSLVATADAKDFRRSSESLAG
jgi:hypothetical protein